MLLDELKEVLVMSRKLAGSKRLVELIFSETFRREGVRPSRWMVWKQSECDGDHYNLYVADGIALGRSPEDAVSFGAGLYGGGYNLISTVQTGLTDKERLSFKEVDKALCKV